MNKTRTEYIPSACHCGRSDCARCRQPQKTREILNIKCDYCGRDAELVTGKDIYSANRKELHNKKFYRCDPCQAWVGCHPGTGHPLGRLADRTLRRWKMLAHQHFDPIWQSELMTRRQAYNWLADKMGLHVNDCHIGMFTVDQCRKVVDIMMLERKQYAQYK